MQLWLDTALTAEWQAIAGCAPLHGVTTNPTLIRQAGLQVRLSTYFDLIAAAKNAGIPALMLQLPSADAAQCRDWAQALQTEAQAATVANLAITFKLPCHHDWGAAHTALKAAGHATLLTGVSNPVQLLWAQAHGANYVAPYFGRLEAAGRDVRSFARALVAVQERGGPKLMAASVKTIALFTDLLAMGAYACTVKPAFLQMLTHDNVTSAAMMQFELDCAA